ncbi:hypothetical protein M409DRAFT_57270 [Zasmidium cellare ATCC 36951]|uniref:Uncharacterized protein n=1 Tax=Zasmidium cellare ATCC 36951 TaxID=1080233 RepID=A0A6A6CC45_ZASCE|nr:uncharacterized protein M409DRAFT_57270 [Zasmidium cellare ATCC 36951]KAF2163788.1 hypothetical protein M409DRAFT_57270 [Zasmidium cellare ATCC 36951]
MSLSSACLPSQCHGQVSAEVSGSGLKAMSAPVVVVSNDDCVEKEQIGIISKLLTCDYAFCLSSQRAVSPPQLSSPKFQQLSSCQQRGRHLVPMMQSINVWAAQTSIPKACKACSAAMSRAESCRGRRLWLLHPSFYCRSTSPTCSRRELHIPSLQRMLPSSSLVPQQSTADNTSPLPYRADSCAEKSSSTSS